DSRDEGQDMQEPGERWAAPHKREGEDEPDERRSGRGEQPHDERVAEHLPLIGAVVGIEVESEISQAEGAAARIEKSLPDDSQQRVDDEGNEKGCRNEEAKSKRRVAGDQIELASDLGQPGS